jgi:Beta-glucanase/Beta-glucan synthetase
MNGKVFLLAAMTLGAACAKPAPDPSVRNMAPVPPPIAATGAGQPTGQAEGWTLAFADEFEGTSLDGRKWVTCYWWNKDGCTNLGNRELQWYQPGNVTVAGGQLRLRAEPAQAKGHNGAVYDYTSGLVSTGRDVDDVTHPVRYAFKYGFTEMRARLPAGRGLLPAFWMLPTDHTYDPEIDIMEMLGQDPHVLYGTLHYRAELAGALTPRGVVRTPDLSADWHVFGLEWGPDRLVWYLDGAEWWRYANADHTPHQPMYLLVNLAVGGNWPGSPDGSTRWPADMHVDYVRVWKRNEQKN